MARSRPSSSHPSHPARPHTQHVSTDKARSVFFANAAAFPLRDAPPVALEQYWAERRRETWATDPKAPDWECAGPFNVAGRVTSLAVDPRDVNVLWAGAAAGGVWVSRNGGRTWKPVWQRWANQNIGALALHPCRPGMLLCGTGEANMSADSYPGSGIYLSHDGGRVWENFASAECVLHGGLPDAFHIQQGVPRRIGAIALDPFDPGKGQDHPLLALGSISLMSRMPAALYLTVEPGRLEPVTFWGTRNYNVNSVLYHPKARGCLFASLEGMGARTGIWRSDDSGRRWRRLGRGLPGGDMLGRISLALAPSRPDTLYAGVGSRTGSFLGVYRSRDRGESWQRIGDPAQIPGEGQLFYNNTIAVHPEDSGFVMWGGIELHRTRNGGRTWSNLSAPTATRPRIVHADQHAIVMPGGDLIYAGNDGGVAVSHDGGDTWRERSRGMVTTMFYAMDVSATDGQRFGGGCQDQGTLITGIPGQKNGNFERALAGDGGWMLIHPGDSEHVFGSSQGIRIRRHRRGDPWGFETWQPAEPSDQVMDPSERGLRSLVVLHMEPRRRGHRGARRIPRIWLGTSRLWQSDDDGQTWRPVSEVFDGSVISTIESAPADPRWLYVGTMAGGIYRSRDGGRTWSGSLSGNELPRRMITSVRTHPLSARAVAVAVASSGSVGASLAPSAEGERREQPFSHIFFSTNAGNDWNDLDNGELPNVVFSALEFETRPPYRLFAGGDTGVYVRTGSGWVALLNEFPSVVVSDLVYHHRDRMLYAATYGRGIWRMPVARLRHGR